MTDESHPRPIPEHLAPDPLHYTEDGDPSRPRTLQQRLREVERSGYEEQVLDTLHDRLDDANNELTSPETALEIKEINELSWASRIEDGTRENATESDKKRMAMSPKEFRQDTIDQYVSRVYETYGLTDEYLQYQYPLGNNLIKRSISDHMNQSTEELEEEIIEKRIFTENLVSRLEEGADLFDVIAEHIEEKRKDQVLQPLTETSPVPNAPDKETIKPDEVISGPIKLTTAPEDPGKKTYAWNAKTTPNNTEGVTDNVAQTNDFEVFADPPLINPQTNKIEEPKKTPSEIFKEEFNNTFEELKRAKAENNREAYQKGLRKLISIKNKREEAIDDTLGSNFLKPYTKELAEGFNKRVQSRRKLRPTREERKRKREARPGMVDRYKRATQWYEDKRYTHASGEKVLRRAIGVAVSAERSYKTAKRLKRHLFK